MNKFDDNLELACMDPDDENLPPQECSHCGGDLPCFAHDHLEVEDGNL